MSTTKILYLYDAEVGKYNRSENTISEIYINEEYQQERVINDVIKVISQDVKNDEYKTITVTIQNNNLKIDGKPLSHFFVQNGFTKTGENLVKQF
jgi:hypothetical protein